MAYNNITVTPLAPAIGAEIMGVDLRRELTESVFEEITEAWLKHLVLFFDDQPLNCLLYTSPRPRD